MSHTRELIMQFYALINCGDEKEGKKAEQLETNISSNNKSSTVVEAETKKRKTFVSTVKHDKLM